MHPDLGSQGIPLSLKWSGHAVKAVFQTGSARDFEDASYMVEVELTI
jgi:hypothetical protein